MRPPLPNQNTLYWRPARGARLPGSLVNPKIVLKIAAAINPIYAGTTPLYAIPQNHAYAFPQPEGLLLGKAVREL